MNVLSEMWAGVKRNEDDFVILVVQKTDLGLRFFLGEKTVGVFLSFDENFLQVANSPRPQK